MPRQRSGSYVWVSWLAKLMAGDVQCQWASWFRAHFTGYVKAPSDFQRAAWTVEHNRCLDELCRDRAEQALGYFKESQNSFTVKRGSMAIGGKPDLVVLEKDNTCTVYDIKTGQPRNSDIVQVMLYMSFLPYSTSAIYRGKTINGCVVYKSGDRTSIPSQALDDAFRSQITHFLNILDLPEPPRRIPSHAECRFCDITARDCPDRIESGPGPGGPSDLPL